MIPAALLSLFFAWYWSKDSPQPVFVATAWIIFALSDVAAAYGHKALDLTLSSVSLMLVAWMYWLRGQAAGQQQ